LQTQANIKSQSSIKWPFRKISGLDIQYIRQVFAISILGLSNQVPLKIAHKPMFAQGSGIPKLWKHQGNATTDRVVGIHINEWAEVQQLKTLFKGSMQHLGAFFIMHKIFHNPCSVLI
jgi:hypothetical protein